MNEAIAQNRALTLIADGYHNPHARVVYVYCTGRYALLVETFDECCILLDEDAVNVYRTTHLRADGT